MKTEVLVYRLASRIHWLPRERQVSALLLRLRNETGAITRVIDVGCGPGDLALTARSADLHYLGTDTACAFIEQARRRHRFPGIDFCTTAFTDIPLSSKDVVVMNGVVHHLADDVLAQFLAHARQAGGVVICDHRRDPANLSFVADWLQRHDKGKFVRDYARFSALPGFRRAACVEFSISLSGLPIWPMFCALYRPEAGAVQTASTERPKV